MTWQQANRAYLMAALDLVKGRVLLAAGHTADLAALEAAVDAAGARLASPAALQQLCHTFRLSPFERDLLLLCAAADLDSDFIALFAALQGGAERAFATFGLALALLPNAHWTAILPDGALRHWHFVDVAANESITRAALRMDERILHHLAGAIYLDERLAGLLRPVDAAAALTPSQQRLAGEIGGMLAAADASVPVVALAGADGATAAAIAAQVCATLGLSLYRLRHADLPASAAERARFARLWEREALLRGAALLVELEEGAIPGAVHALLDDTAWPIFVTSRLPVTSAARRPLVRYAVDTPDAGEQCARWEQALAARGISLNGFVPRLAAHFNLPGAAIDAATAVALSQPATDGAIDPGAVEQRLWDACRAQARPRLEDVAQRVVTAAGWDDLVLPRPQLETLHEIAAHVRRRHIVYTQWGFAERSPRGLGTSVVFAGASGTGKTLAAEILANELRLDLYRIDLSAVVSKYIGETEKNLRRVFDAAEVGGAILLFDEADALFGKRSEVKDSHDRYANIEVSYLLQQMESYRGLAILTTNMLGAFDNAFLRRIRFVVQFPAPTPAERAAIWARIFPPATPTDELDLRALARLNVTGGNIRNIALNAAFLAADAGEPVGMAHLLRAATVEYAKLERPLTAAETRDWGQP
ncbi:MAG TPA: ATP-binding protein [Caldilinea sp.]|nr:ATP-binding protein [Caldilinea sp.]